MLTTGNMVHCGLDGVCCVMGIVEKKVDGHINRYYELHPYFRKNDIIFLPEDNQDILSRLRPLISRKDIDNILENAPDSICLWVEPEPLRRESFKAILRNGDPLELIGLIRTLYERRLELMKSGKKLRTSDTAFLKDAERLLNEEFAYVLDITPQEVPDFIKQQLLARQ